MEMRIRFPGNKKVNADFDGFSLATDQPIEAGGDGSAPAPFDLFLASIGTCAGISLGSLTLLLMTILASLSRVTTSSGWV